MTTETDKGKTLTEQEGNELFAKAYAEAQGTEYKPPVQVDSPPVEEVVATEEVPTEEVVPTEKEKPEEKVEEVEKKEEPKAQPSLDDVLNAIPEDKRDFVKQLYVERNLAEQKFKSHAGRLAAERRELTQLKQELNKLRKGASSPQPNAVAEQTKADHAKALEEWKQVAEIEPTLAKAVDALTDAKVGDLEKRLEARTTSEKEAADIQRAEEEKHREWELLVEHVPNVADVIGSKEFHYWKDNLASPAIKNMAENSVKHQDCIFVLQQFAPYAIWLNEQEAAKNKSPDPKPSTEAADKISETRKDKVSPVVNKGQLPINTSPNVGNEFGEEVAEQLFAEAYNKIKNR